MENTFNKFNRVLTSDKNREWGAFPFEGLNISQVELYYLLYGEFFSKKKDYIKPSNKGIADKLGLAIETVSRYLAKLEEKGFIKLEYEPNKNGTIRRIKVKRVPLT